MKNLVYYMFSPGVFSLEIVYSLHTAYHFLQGRSDYRFIIYCPPEVSFEGVRADIVHYSPSQLTAWAGPYNFRWRVKIKTLCDVLQKYGEPAVLIDGDTYFRKSPDRLFGRVQPGRSVLHIREGRVCDMNDEEHRDMSTLLMRADIRDPINNARILPQQAMWNSGVMGIHPADHPLLEQAVELTDRITAVEPVNTSEQFALSAILESHTKLQPCDDIVFHYWSMRYRRPFRAVIQELVDSTRGLPEAERARMYYERRTRPRLAKTVLNRGLQFLDSAGLTLFRGDPRQSG